MGRDILVALLAFAGAALLAVWLYGRLLRPLPRGLFRVVVPGRGEGEGLEQAIRAVAWLKSLGLLNCTLVIADVDLTDGGRQLALHLADRWPGVVLWPARELNRLIEP